MATTFQNSAIVLSIGIFFSLMIIGLAGSLPGTLHHGLVAQGVPPADATRISHLPPVGLLFASFLGYNPMQQLLGPVLPHLSHAPGGVPDRALVLPGADVGAVLGRTARGVRLRDRGLPDRRRRASWLRGGKYVHVEPAIEAPEGEMVLAGDGD